MSRCRLSKWYSVRGNNAFAKESWNYLSLKIQNNHFLMSFDEEALSTCTTFFNFMQNSKINAKFDAFASQLNKKIWKRSLSNKISKTGQKLQKQTFLSFKFKKIVTTSCTKKKFFFTQKTEKREKKISEWGKFERGTSFQKIFLRRPIYFQIQRGTKWTVLI